MRGSRWPVALLAVGLAACSGRGGPAAPDDPGAGDQRRRCCAVVPAARVPTFDDLTRAGTRGSVALWRRDATVADTLVLSVRWGEQGLLEWVRAISDTGPRTVDAAARRDEVERLVHEGMLERARDGVGVRVRIVGSDVDQVLPSIRCPAIRTASAGRVFQPRPTRHDLAMIRRLRGQVFRAIVDLDAMGRVRDVRMLHSSGSQLLDEYVLANALASQYEPELHDGIGVPSQLEVDVRLRWRGET